MPVVSLEAPNRLWFFASLRKLLAWFLRILWLRIWGKLSPEEFAVRLRIDLEEKGGLWIKAGQLLSLRRVNTCKSNVDFAPPFGQLNGGWKPAPHCKLAGC